MDSSKPASPRRLQGDRGALGRLRPYLGVAVAAALVTGCSASTPGTTPPDGVAASTTSAAAAGPGASGQTPARGRAEGVVVDPAAALVVSAIPVRLIRTDTGEAVDAGMSNSDGSYVLEVPDDDGLPDGTLLQVQAELPPDHIFAYGYATPTAFPAGIGGTLHHNILLTGP